MVATSGGPAGGPSNTTLGMRHWLAIALSASLGLGLVTLALLLSPLSVIPLANLFGPVISGLAFTHLCLAELESLRKPAIAAS